MRINAVSNQNLGFRGTWETQRLGKFVHYTDPDRVKKVYIPDENENEYSIAHAWKQETGLLPIDWVKENNPYNQSNSRIQYEVAGSPYMPLNVLKASTEMKYRKIDDYDNNSKIEKHIELAKLAAQENDKEEVETQEHNMINQMKKIPAPSLVMAAAMHMDNYKDNFGTNSMYGIRYGKL